MSTTNKALQAWVEEVAQLTQPEHIHWCDGSAEEFQSLVNQMVGTGELVPLNDETHPNCYLHRSHPSDVARTEHLTFICTRHKQDAGPNNHWMDPAEGHAKVDALFKGAMRGRTLYVIPYCMGPLDSPLARCGVEITDSAYVAANMKIMTRMG
ncbi:MAG: phosphoenolpyruvate carboxykinase, partial [Candidatus Competibacteraceae bacterium]|nr:phosphoenolpyruvate carboxykinase [Candidatus Competibacteraceae bacterium]